MEAIIIVILIVIVIFLIKLVIDKKQEKIKQKMLQIQLVADAKAYIEDAKIKKRFPAGITVLMLTDSEQALFEEKTELIESRAVRNTGGGGVRIRVAKGVSIGGFGAQGESHQAYRVIDQGKITLTNKKIIFSGLMGNRIIPITKIIKFEPFTDGMKIEIDGRSKNVAFHIGNAFLWGAIVNILHSTDCDVSNIPPEIFDKGLEWLKNWEFSEEEINNINKN